MQQYGSARSTIGLRVGTKERLDKCRAPGQCYDGILKQMVDMWEEVHNVDQFNNIHLKERMGSHYTR